MHIYQGLDFSKVMYQIQSAFFGIEAQRFQRGDDEIKVWVRYDKNTRSYVNNMEQMKILTPSEVEFL